MQEILNDLKLIALNISGTSNASPQVYSQEWFLNCQC